MVEEIEGTENGFVLWILIFLTLIVVAHVALGRLDAAAITAVIGAILGIGTYIVEY